MNKKIKTDNRINYILVILFLFASGGVTTVFSRSLIIRTVFIIFTFYFFYKRGFKFDKQIIKIYIVLLIFWIVYFIKFNAYNPLFTYRIFITLLYSYLIFKILGVHFLFYLEDLIYKLALFSIPLFIFQLLSYDVLLNIFLKIESIFPFLKFSSANDANILIFTLREAHPYRNSGFMWEPGAFAAMLLLPIMFNLIFNNFKLNRKLLVLIIAMITTFSTMGYIGLIIIGSWVLYNVKKKYLIIFGPLSFFMIFIIIFNVDFMYSKIFNEYSNIDNTIDQIYSSNTKGIHSFGRMASFVMDYQDLKKNPAFGIGGQHEAITQVHNITTNRTNGLSHYMLTFGAIGLILLLYNLFKSFNLVTAFFHIKGTIFFVLIILILSFSNSLLDTPLFFGFQLMYLFIQLGNKNLKEKSPINVRIN